MLFGVDRKDEDGQIRSFSLHRVVQNKLAIFIGNLA